MDTVTAFVQRQEASVASVATATLDANRTLAVTATYLLSEEGRKVSLLAGGDGRAVQELAVEVPTQPTASRQRRCKRRRATEAAPSLSARW